MAGEFLGQLGFLNGASVYTGILSGSGAQHTTLTAGKCYYVQALSGDAQIGFGSTNAAADTDAGSARGLLLRQNDPAIMVVVQADTTVISRTGDSSSVIIREAKGS